MGYFVGPKPPPPTPLRAQCKLRVWVEAQSHPQAGSPGCCLDVPSGLELEDPQRPGRQGCAFLGGRKGTNRALGDL